MHRNTGERVEGEWEYNRLTGRAKIFLEDGSFSEELEYINDAPQTNDSHMNQRMFCRLLLGRDCKFRTHPSYSIGIMADYLRNKGYTLAAEELSWAHRIHQMPNSTAQELITERLKTGNPCLLLGLSANGFSGHVMGIRFIPVINVPEYVFCELYNRGQGLNFWSRERNHKFQTMQRIGLIRIEDLSPKIAEICNTESPEQHYERVLDLPCASRLPSSETSAIWQTPQNGPNCTLQWIFAYLKNTMGPDYIKMRKELFQDCLTKIEKAPWKEQFPNEWDTTVKELQRKIAKREMSPFEYGNFLVEQMTPEDKEIFESIKKALSKPCKT